MSDFKLSQTFAAVQITGWERQAGGFPVSLLRRGMEISNPLAEKFGASSVGVNLETGVVVVNDATKEDVVATLSTAGVPASEYKILPQTRM